jgi:hypothetical protein
MRARVIGFQIKPRRSEPRAGGPVTRIQGFKWMSESGSGRISYRRRHSEPGGSVPVRRIRRIQVDVWLRSPSGASPARGPPACRGGPRSPRPTGAASSGPPRGTTVGADPRAALPGEGVGSDDPRHDRHARQQRGQHPRGMSPSEGLHGDGVARVREELPRRLTRWASTERGDHLINPPAARIALASAVRCAASSMYAPVEQA